MAEKVIYEVRFLETDDGFRIEINGDKERMRKMGFGPGMGFGSWMRFGKRHHRRHGRRMWGFGPWAWGCWSEAPEEAEEMSEKPPKRA